MERFHYTTTEGDELTVPYMRNLPVGTFRKLRHLSEMDGTFALLEDILDDDGMAAVDRMTLAEFEDFTSQWQRESGIAPGESGGSSPTSNGTGSPSKRTSSVPAGR
jgi:hypothetical protein